MDQSLMGNFMLCEELEQHSSTPHQITGAFDLSQIGAGFIITNLFKFTDTITPAHRPSGSAWESLFVQSKEARGPEEINHAPESFNENLQDAIHSIAPSNDAHGVILPEMTTADMQKEWSASGDILVASMPGGYNTTGGSLTHIYDIDRIEELEAARDAPKPFSIGYKPFPLFRPFQDTANWITGSRNGYERRLPWIPPIKGLNSLTSQYEKAVQLRTFVASLWYLSVHGHDSLQDGANTTSSAVSHKRTLAQVSGTKEISLSKRQSHHPSNHSLNGVEFRHPRDKTLSPLSLHELKQCPFKDGRRNKRTNKLLQGTECSYQFHSQEELDEHVLNHDHHHACPQCAFDSEKGTYTWKDNNWFPKREERYNHVSAKHWKQHWIPCVKCKKYKTQMHTPERLNVQWTVCSSCRKGTNAFNRFWNETRPQVSTTLAVARKEASNWNGELCALADAVRSARNGVAVRDLLIVDGRVLYDAETKTDNLNYSNEESNGMIHTGNSDDNLSDHEIYGSEVREDDGPMTNHKPSEPQLPVQQGSEIQSRLSDNSVEADIMPLLRNNPQFRSSVLTMLITEFPLDYYKMVYQPMESLQPLNDLSIIFANSEAGVLQVGDSAYNSMSESQDITPMENIDPLLIF